MMIFTDGSYSNHPNMCGIGVVILDGKKEFEFGAYTDKCKDNNISEIYAIAYAFKKLNQCKSLKNNKDKHIILVTDSLYAINTINDKRSGRDELEQQALDYIHYTMDNCGKTVSLFHIKGHIHNNTKLSYYNRIADQIAGDYRFTGLVKYKNQIFKATLKNKGRI